MGAFDDDWDFWQAANEQADDDFAHDGPKASDAPASSSGEPFASDAGALLALTPPRPLPVAGEGDEVVVKTPVKRRRRISRKTPRPEAFQTPSKSQQWAVCPVGVGGDEEHEVWPHLQMQGFVKMPIRAQYFFVYNRLRFWLVTEKLIPGLDGELLRKARESWKLLSRNNKAIVSRAFCRHTKAPPCILELRDLYWPGGGDGDKRTNWVYAKSVLLTWNGDWGLLGDVPEGVVTEPELVDWAWACPAAKELWNEFRDFVENVVASLGAQDYALSLEIAGGTWEASGSARMHTHLYLRSDKKLFIASGSVVAFKNSIPNRSSQLFGLQNRQAGSNAGLYYVVAPKRYSLARFSPKEPFQDFMVSPEWVFNMVQASKMDYEPAKRELVSCGKGLVRRLGDLDKWWATKQELQLQERARQVQEALRKTQKAFKSYPLVDKWLAQSTQELQARKKFLVLTGPTGVGKSVFVRSLFKQGEVFELNCASLEHPVLTGFVARQHKCIFWDELSATVVPLHRKVFQHPAAFVDLGHSPTGSHVQRFWLNDSVSIIASNRWAEDLQLLSPSDRDWVCANSVVLDVQERMWLE